MQHRNARASRRSALGHLAAADILDGGEPLLEPFRLDRFERGALHPTSSRPYPWT
jgi:hypothetical protein